MVHKYHHWKSSLIIIHVFWSFMLYPDVNYAIIYLKHCQFNRVLVKD